MMQQPQNDFRSKLELLFMILMIVITAMIGLWCLLGTFFMQLLIAGCVFGGIFCLGAWMNDQSQNRHTRIMLEATNALSNLVIQTNRGMTRVETKQIEARSQIGLKQLEMKAMEDEDEIEEIN